MEDIIQIINAIISFVVVRFFYGTEEKPASAISRWVFRSILVCAFVYSVLGMMYLYGMPDLVLLQYLFPVSFGMSFVLLFFGWVLATAGYYGEKLVNNERLGYLIAAMAVFILVALAALGWA